MRIRRVLITAFVALSGVALIYWASRPQAVMVQLAEISSGIVERTVANTRAGTLRACRRAGLSLSVGGQIDTLLVHEGQAVAAGSILLELWNEDLEAQLDLALQELRASRAKVAEACARSKVAQHEAERLVSLRGKGLSSEEAAERAAGEAAATAAACSGAHAAVAVSDARVRVQNANLERTRLRAPFDGVVAEINGELSEFVTPSPVGVATPPAIDLIDNTCLYVTAPIDEVDAPSVRAGMPVRIHLDAFAAENFPGSVRRVAPYVQDVERQSRTVDIEVDFDAGPQTSVGALMPGYSADIEILLERREQTLRVPAAAVLEDRYVLVHDAAGNTLERREFTPGIGNWRWVEVTAGLAEGERVVTTVDRAGVEEGAYVAEEAVPGS